jgi:tyrosine phenol-lyase
MSDWPFRTVIEPFRIKAIESIPILSREAREGAIARAHHNLFGLHADEVTIDLLTDSGTGAMSAEQWAAMLRGDESYAGSRSFQHFYETLHKLTGYPHIFPVHQGRAAERILSRTVLPPGCVVLNNTHFDTTRANVEQAGAQARDLPDAAAADPSSLAPFKGNMDIPALERALAEDREKIALVMLTMTNNAVGGQPVSMANVEAVSARCRVAGVPFFLDAARFAENAWFVKERERGFSNWSLPEIARRFFDLADGCTLSAKKDGIAHIGGVLATRRDDWAAKFRDELILGEGFPTYGGLAGRDLDAIAIGLEEALDPDYLRYRVRTVAYLVEGLKRVGMPVVEPAGGHAVYLDAGRLLPQLPASAFPGQALAHALYVEGGIRGCEVGSLMFPEARLQLVRLALPRRVYTQAHIDFVIEVAERLVARAKTMRGWRIREAPRFLRHFTARLEELPQNSGAGEPT